MDSKNDSVPKCAICRRLGKEVEMIKVDGKWSCPVCNNTPGVYVGNGDGEATDRTEETVVSHF